MIGAHAISIQVNCSKHVPTIVRWSHLRNFSRLSISIAWTHPKFPAKHKSTTSFMLSTWVTRLWPSSELKEQFMGLHGFFFTLQGVGIGGCYLRKFERGQKTRRTSYSGATYARKERKVCWAVNTGLEALNYEKIHRYAKKCFLGSGLKQEYSRHVCVNNTTVSE